MRDEGAYKELLAPLATSRSGLMMLLAGDLGELAPSQQEYIEQILQLNEHLIGLINSWEDLERLNSGRVVLQAEPCNIGLLIRRTAPSSITVSRRGRWPMVLGDATRIKQLLHNVFEAAGEGAIRARSTGEMCIITIETKHEIDHQTRLQWVRALKGEATKHFLGLQISKLLAQVHGGDLQLDPHATGSAKFHIRLPLAQQLSLLGDPAA